MTNYQERLNSKQDNLKYTHIGELHIYLNCVSFWCVFLSGMDLYLDLGTSLGQSYMDDWHLPMLQVFHFYDANDVHGKSPVQHNLAFIIKIEHILLKMHL